VILRTLAVNHSRAARVASLTFKFGGGLLTPRFSTSYPNNRADDRRNCCRDYLPRGLRTGAP
jgi:hypothetical protein